MADDRVRGAARDALAFGLWKIRYHDHTHVMTLADLKDHVQAEMRNLVDEYMPVVVLADDAAERVREAQERADWITDRLKLLCYHGVPATAGRDFRDFADAVLATLTADPPAPRGDAEGYVCEECGCWNPTGDPCKYEDEHPIDDEASR